MDKDLYELPPAEYHDIPKLPCSLDAALDALRADQDFLTEGEVFTPDLIETWINYKEQNEVAPCDRWYILMNSSFYYDI